MSREASGDVIFHGFDREVPDLGRVYDPGFEFVNLPLFVGKTWISSCESYSDPELESEGTLTFEYEVLGSRAGAPRSPRTGRYRRQNAGTNSTMIVKSSSRPSSMQPDNTSFPATGTDE